MRGEGFRGGGLKCFHPVDFLVVFPSSVRKMQMLACPRARCVLTISFECSINMRPHADECVYQSFC